MDTQVLKSIGLSENEIKIYITLLKGGSATAYELSQRTGIYRTHIYDKLEQLMKKGLVSHNYQAAKKYFQAASPKKIKDYIDGKKKELEIKEKQINDLLPQLEAMVKLPEEDTRVEVFKGREGLKYFLKDIIKTKKEVLVTGIDDSKYNEALPIFMEQYFRDLRLKKIPERIITIEKKKAFTFNKKTAPSTKYRFLDEKQFNPTNTFIYGDKVVIVSWGTPATATMIKNKGMAATYRSHFEILWKAAKK